jgi:thiol-disulfide isomerase/thioredoxin
MKKLLIVFFAAVLGASCAGGPSKPEPSGNSANAERRTSKYPPVSPTIMMAESRMLDESTLRLEDLKGKTVLVNLWATWCGPCRKEIPHLVELQKKYGDSGLIVVGLDVDPETKEEVDDYVKQMNINYRIGWAQETLSRAIANLTKMNGIPQTILINRHGELTGVFLGGGGSVIEKMKETVAKTIND